ncbi:fumarylacetoacetate hydrolase family protein [Rhizobium terrae]|uniref:fumarylacetoacetate hydrolase family protein n=1 Tax=Rhizobium terrae TaxID=2171756 RepID=UPI000E3D1DBB|nr:fumarylacetoacetate hydrolase family protein [Rhizobium terrae]
MTTSNARRHGLADAIRNAIQSQTTIDPEPFLGLPLAEGFGIQAEIFRSFGQPLKGSKLTLKGGLCHSAPLLQVSENAQQPYQPGLSVEVELAFVLGKDVVAGNGAVSRQDIVDAIAAVRIGAELLRSRYQGGARGDQGLAVADFMSNIGYVLGPELGRHLLDQDAEIGRLLLVINSETAYDKVASHADGDPLKTIVALANQTPMSPFPMLKAGQVVTTGTLCGLVPVGAAGKVEINMAGRQFLLNVG